MSPAPKSLFGPSSRLIIVSVFGSRFKLISKVLSSFLMLISTFPDLIAFEKNGVVPSNLSFIKLSDFCYWMGVMGLESEKKKHKGLYIS